MQTSLTMFIGVAVVVAVVAAAAGFGPMLLRPGATSPGNPEVLQGPIGVPQWSIGDSWTYDVKVTVTQDPARVALLPEWLGIPSFTGHVSSEVTGTAAEGTAHVVTVSGTFELDGTLSGQMGALVVTKSATVEGYTWYRMADLARLLDVRTVRIEGSIAYGDHAVHASFTVITETTYEPPWDAWSFPLEEAEGWTVDTTATVHGVANFRVEWPDGWLEYEKRFSHVVPVMYSAASNGFEDVVTPAGTFHALRISFQPPTPAAAPAMDPEVALAVGIGDALPMSMHASTDAWFNAEVGNVVRFVGTDGGSAGLRLEIVLVAYHRA